MLIDEHTMCKAVVNDDEEDKRFCSTDECKDVVYIYNGIPLSHKDERNLASFAAIWMEPGG